MDLNTLVTQYPPLGPLLEFRGAPDFSHFFEDWFNTYPSLRQLVEVITSRLPH